MTDTATFGPHPRPLTHPAPADTLRQAPAIARVAEVTHPVTEADPAVTDAATLGRRPAHHAARRRHPTPLTHPAPDDAHREAPVVARVAEVTRPVTEAGPAVTDAATLGRRPAHHAARRRHPTPPARPAPGDALREAPAIACLAEVTHPVTPGPAPEADPAMTDTARLSHRPGHPAAHHRHPTPLTRPAPGDALREAPVGAGGARAAGYHLAPEVRA
ncbi:hypothetical protein [Streptomyces sp. NPDC102490]|uniref:hypothetical protein n=1 Tax=Streptomyces sp. NPDC102490 TaxID=3366183 RepID=UPI0037F5D381